MTGYVANGPADASGAFDLCFDVPQNVVTGPISVKAVGVQTHSPVTLGFNAILPVADTQYLVGGSTFGGDTTTVPLLNTGPLTTTMTLTFYTHRRAPTAASVMLPPHSSTVVQANAYVPAGRDVWGARPGATRAIATQMIVRRANKAPYALTGTHDSATTTYLAGGTTSGTFHEILYLLNPQSVDATARIRVVPVGRGKARTLVAAVAANHTAAFELNRVYPGQSISAIVHSDQPAGDEPRPHVWPPPLRRQCRGGCDGTWNQVGLPQRIGRRTRADGAGRVQRQRLQKGDADADHVRRRRYAAVFHTERILPQKHVDIDLNTVAPGHRRDDPHRRVPNRCRQQRPAVYGAKPLQRRSRYNPGYKRVPFEALPSPLPGVSLAVTRAVAHARRLQSVIRIKVPLRCRSCLSSPGRHVKRRPSTSWWQGSRMIVNVSGTIILPASVHGIHIATQGNTPVSVEQSVYSPVLGAGFFAHGSSP